MYRKILAGLLVVSCLWLVQSTVASLHSDASPQIKSLNTAVQFKKEGNGPDPNEIFTLANKAREEQGLAPLQANQLLTNVAEARAKDMAANHYYDHQDKSGHFYYDLFPQNHISVRYSCENLDMEYVNDAQTYVNDWLYSPFGHRQCLMNRETTDAGYAIAQIQDVNYGGDKQTAYIVVAIYSTPPNSQTAQTN